MEPHDRLDEAGHTEAGQTKVHDLPALPNIADYWPDAPHRMGPAADTHELPDAEPTRIGRPLHIRAEDAPKDPPTEELPRVRSKGNRKARGALGVLAAVVLIAGSAYAVGRMVTRSTEATPAIVVTTDPVTAAPTTSAAAPGPAVVLPSPTPTTSAPAPSAAATLTGKDATFWLMDDLTTLSITTARLDQGVARISTPKGNTAVPKITMTGTVLKLGVGTNGDDGDTEVDVVLDDRIDWTLRFGGGAKNLAVDMRGGQVASVDLERGFANVDLRLPDFDGTMPVRMAGGVNTWKIKTQGKVDVRVDAARGGGDVVLYGRDRGGLGLGDSASFNTDGSDKLTIDARQGFGTLSVSES